MESISRQRAEQARRDQETDRLLWWGWITAILIAPVGFVIGVVLLTKGRVGHGVGMMVVALLVTASLLSTV